MSTKPQNVCRHVRVPLVRYSVTTARHSTNTNCYVKRKSHKSCSSHLLSPPLPLHGTTFLPALLFSFARTAILTTFSLSWRYDVLDSKRSPSHGQLSIKLTLDRHSTPPLQTIWLRGGSLEKGSVRYGGPPSREQCNKGHSTTLARWGFRNPRTACVGVALSQASCVGRAVGLICEDHSTTLARRTLQTEVPLTKKQHSRHT